MSAHPSLVTLAAVVITAFVLAAGILMSPRAAFADGQKWETRVYPSSPSALAAITPPRELDVKDEIAALERIQFALSEIGDGTSYVWRRWHGRLAGVIDKLVVYPKNMQKNLDRLGGLVHSQRVLIALTKAGVSREDAYRIVQASAMRVWQDGEDFLTLLKADPQVRKALSAKEIEANFDLKHHFKHVDTIFKRVFGKS